MIFSLTDLCENKARFCGIYPKLRFSGEICRIECPSMSISPSDGLINPNMSFNKVVFPHPEEPRIPIISPFFTDKEILDREIVFSNRFVTPVRFK